MSGADAPACWAVTTGETGMISQVTGLAEAVGIRFALKTVGLRAPWRWLPGHLCPWALYGLDASSDALGVPPWPDLLITCGRRAVAVSIAVRRASAGRTFTLHVQDPKVPPDRFDLVLAPRHDGVSGGNVIQTRAALHGVTPERLAAAAEHFAKLFGALPRPRVAVLIGGTSRAYRLSPAIARGLATRLAGLAHGAAAGLMVTASRRTGAQNMTILRDGLRGTGAYIWDGAGENPYFGMLALADHLLVTEDSVSMVSEACATGKPVQTIALEGGTERLRAFHRGLIEDGHTRPFEGRLESWDTKPLLETQDCAKLVREKLALKT